MTTTKIYASLNDLTKQPCNAYHNLPKDQELDGSHSIIPFSIRLFFSAVSIAAPIPIASQIALFVGLAVLLLAPHAIVSSSATSFAVSSLLSISVSTVTPPLSCPNLINLLFSVYRLEKEIVNKEKEIVNKEEEATFSKIEKSKKEKTKLGAALNCKASEHIEPCDILHGQNIGIGELLSDNQYNALVTLHAPAIVQELQMKGILSLTSEELVKVAVTRVIAFAESKAIDMSKTGHFAQTLNWGLTAAKEQYSKQTTNKNATYQPTAQTIANIAAYCNYIAAASRQH